MKLTSSLALALPAVAALLATLPAQAQIISPYSAQSGAQSSAQRPASLPTSRSFYSPPTSGYAIHAPVSAGTLPNPTLYTQPYNSYSGQSTNPYSGQFPIYVGVPYIPTPGYTASGGATYALPNAVSGFTGNYGRRQNNYFNSSNYFYGSGYYFPYYCPAGYQSGLYQSAYSLYGDFPTYFYAPDDGLVVISGDPTIFNPYTGQYYIFNNDPYDYSGNTIPVGGNYQSDAAASDDALPPDWSSAFAPIGQAWQNDNSQPIDGYLPSDGSDNGGVAVGLNGQYGYSMTPAAYQAMTRDAMNRLATTDFRFTDARVRPNGSATAYAIQRYRTATGAQGTVFLSYTLQRDRALASGYRLVGVDTSTQPMSTRQRALVARADANSIARRSTD